MLFWGVGAESFGPFVSGFKIEFCSVSLGLVLFFSSWGVDEESSVSSIPGSEIEVSSIGGISTSIGLFGKAPHPPNYGHREK